MDGLLGPREHDGLGGAAHEIAEGRRRVGHGVRAVGHHETVVLVVIPLDGPGDHQPVGRGHVRAVDVQHLDGVGLADVFQARHCPQKLLPGDGGREATFRIARGDGPPGGNQQYLLHGCSIAEVQAFCKEYGKKKISRSLGRLILLVVGLAWFRGDLTCRTAS